MHVQSCLNLLELRANDLENKILHMPYNMCPTTHALDMLRRESYVYAKRKTTKSGQFFFFNKIVLTLYDLDYFFHQFSRYRLR